MYRAHMCMTAALRGSSQLLPPPCRRISMGAYLGNDTDSKKKGTPAKSESKAGNADHGLSADAVKRATAQRLAALKELTSDEAVLRALQALVSVLARYPLASAEAYHLGGIATLLAIRRRYPPSSDIGLWAKQASRLLGYADPLQQRGLRILSLDGGGVRGVLSVVVLERLLKLCGDRPVSDLFDVVAGTSVGALISALLMFAEKQPGPLATQFIDMLNSVVRLPVTDTLANVVKYRTIFGNEMVNLLEKHFQDMTMTDTSRLPGIPKVLYVASVFGKGRETHPAPFLFRNYRLSPAVKSRYQGGCNYSLAHACAATSAAPGFFPGINLGGMPVSVKDGGVLGNNPLCIALHESRLLWGNDVPIRCIVSLGTGLVPLPQVDTHEEFSEGASLASEITSASGMVDLMQNIVNSACNNQVMEHIMDDMLDSDYYFRFNPPLPCDYPPFTEDLPEILNLAEDFLASSEDRLAAVAQKLTT